MWQIVWFWEIICSFCNSCISITKTSTYFLFILDSLSAQMNVPNTKFSRKTMKHLNHNASTLSGACNGCVAYYDKQINTYYVFILFRNCIGQNFAMTEMKITIATLLHNFDFSLNTSIPIEVEDSIIQRAKKGIHLFIKPRRLKHCLHLSWGEGRWDPGQNTSQCPPLNQDQSDDSWYSPASYCGVNSTEKFNWDQLQYFYTADKAM